MAITRCDKTTLQGRVIAALNAATAGTWSTTVSSTDDNRRNTTEIQNAILAADAQVCLAICETLGHGYRSLFLASSGDLAHGAVIPDHIGPIEQVTIKHVSSDTDYKAGKFDKDLTLADIERWRANTGTRYVTAHNAANSATSGFYIVQGSQIFFTGNVAKVQIANFTRTTSCQAPESYEDTVLCLAVMNLVKEGDTSPYAQVFLSEAGNHLSLIRGGAMATPPLQLAEAA